MTLRRPGILFASFVLMGLGAFMAQQARASRYWEEPPRHYRDAGRDLDRAGHIEWHVDDGRMDWLCGERDLGGCAIPWPDGACDVYLAPDAFDDRDARDHEGAHCAGWDHS